MLVIEGGCRIYISCCYGELECRSTLRLNESSGNRGCSVISEQHIMMYVWM